MIAHQDLVDRVAAHEEIADTEEAQRVVHAVITSLSPHLAPEARKDLRRSSRNPCGRTWTGARLFPRSAPAPWPSRSVKS